VRKKYEDHPIGVTMNYTQEELSDSNFLKKQVSKYTERIKNAKKKVAEHKSHS